MSNGKIKTGELSQRAGVNKETLRFYERKGLLPTPERTEAGYRLYNDADIDRIRFIKNAQELGFSLGEIKELLTIADGNVVDCNEVRVIAEKKLRFVHSKIDSLKRLESVLNQLVKRCAKAAIIDGCPIIESISERGKPDED